MKAGLIPVQSTNIHAIGYQAESRCLWVAFAGGPLWRYEDVPPEKWEAFRTAPSIGGFFAREIRPHHAGMRAVLPEDATAPDADERANAS